MNIICEICGHSNKNPNQFRPMDSPVAPPEIQYPQHKICPECKEMMELVEWHNPTPIFGKTKSCDYRCEHCSRIERLKAYEEHNLWIYN